MGFELRLAGPAEQLLDDPCDVLVAGAEPGARVDVTVTCDYGTGSVSRAQATFVADDAGEVEVCGHAPVAGDWSGDASGQGPWWSATPAPGTATVGDDDRCVPTIVEARARDAGGTARLEFIRLRIRDGVSEERIVGDGYRATVWTAPPAIAVARFVWFGGASGGEPLTPGPLLASRGVTTMAVAYFGAPGLPATLRDIPVELAARAAEDLHRRTGTRAPAIVVGVSRGAELALLAAAHFPVTFAGAIGLVPSSRVHALPGTTLDNIQYPWVLHGEPVPLLSDIPTDRIPGPLLLLSAEDDRVMPTPKLAARAIEARAAGGHPLDRHVSYPGSGHTFFGYPGLPVVDPLTVRHPTTGRPLLVGGDRGSNASACSRAWTEMINFAGQVARMS